VGGGFGVSGSTSSSGLKGSAGMWGHNFGSGPGVRGTSGSGAGIYGVTSTGGTGVHAENDSASGGLALHVVGAAAFSRSGLVTITAPKASATVSVPGGLSSSALVFALLQTAAAGVYVSAAVPNHSASTITVQLNKAPAAGHTVKAAWFVVN
jgi:hypothetical protein